MLKSLLSRPMKALYFFVLHIASFISLPMLVVPTIGNTPFIIPVFITLTMISVAAYVMSALWASDAFDFNFAASKSLLYQRLFFGVFAFSSCLWLLTPLMSFYGGWWIALFAFIGLLYFMSFGISLVMKGK